MYALVQRYTIKDMSDLDGIVDLFKVGFVPIVKRSPGFVTYHLINAGNNILMSFSLFREEAGVDETARMAAGYVQQVLGQDVQESTEVAQGEVLIHEFK
jgi:hypothetical protein